MKSVRDTTSISDGDLWVRLRKRDMASLEALYDRYGSYVYALALRMLGRAEDAEEVVQDVFWQLWKNDAECDPARSAFRTWLFAITRSRFSTGCGGIGAAPFPSCPEAPGSDRHRRIRNRRRFCPERQKHVVAAFQALSEPQRQAPEMGFFNGLTHREIAERLGEPLGTVKSRIKMGMDKLKDSLRSFEES